VAESHESGVIQTIKAKRQAISGKTEKYLSGNRERLCSPDKKQDGSLVAG
jgi:hypothetical protein